MRRHNRTFLIVGFSCLFLPGSQSVVPETGLAHAGPQERTPIMVEVRENLERLLAEEDTDGDKKITINDTHMEGKSRDDKRFWLIATNGKRYEIDRTYYLSNLLQELRLKQRAGLEIGKPRRQAL